KRRRLGTPRTHLPNPNPTPRTGADPLRSSPENGAGSLGGRPYGPAHGRFRDGASCPTPGTRVGAGTACPRGGPTGSSLTPRSRPAISSATSVPAPVPSPPPSSRPAAGGVAAGRPCAPPRAILRRLLPPGSRLVAADLVLPHWVGRRWVLGKAPGAGRWGRDRHVGVDGRH